MTHWEEGLGNGDEGEGSTDEEGIILMKGRVREMLGRVIMVDLKGSEKDLHSQHGIDKKICKWSPHPKLLTYTLKSPNYKSSE